MIKNKAHLKPDYPFSHISNENSLYETRGKNVSVIALGISTGGPNALKKVIPRLPGNLSVPILAVQHMPKEYTSALAENLNRYSSINVVEARSGQYIENGVMYLAPGGKHMVVWPYDGKKMIGIIDNPPANNCKPSVDVLFKSICRTYGGNALSVIMTGMGQDGSAGVAALRKKGAYSIVQDEASSVVWGMAGAIAKAKNADEIVPLNLIAERILKIIS